MLGEDAASARWCGLAGRRRGRVSATDPGIDWEPNRAARSVLGGLGREERTMGIFDRLFGRGGAQPGFGQQQGYGQSAYPAQGNQQQGYAQQGYPRQASSAPRQTPGASMTEDERAIARYEYMLKTAPPEEIEKAHAEAFAKLTPEQRQQVLTRLATDSPQDAPQSADPQALARAATRAEMRQPGFLQSSFGGYGMGGGFGRGGMGMGMGGMGMGSMLLTSVAGAFVGTAIADAMFDDWGNDFDSHDMQDAYQDGYQDGGGDGGGNDVADGGGFDSGQDFAGGSDFGGFDGGDFGGGDFGGDMGGFDF